jgi:KDO2-lipid IV(A) lauroyltransferase
VERRSDWAAFLALRAALVLARLGPRGAARASGALLGRLLRTPLGLRRRVADENLAAAFPELSPPERRDLARRMYAHFGRTTADTLRLSARGSRSVVELTDGREEAERLVRQYSAAGRGILVLTGHLGNWELAGAYLSSLIPTSAVVKPPANPWVARYAQAARQRLGIATIPMPEARSGVLRALGDGRAVALVADQGAMRGATWAPFFGRPTKTPEGPGLFAARSGAPVLFGVLLARPDGRYRIVGDVLEEEARGETREVVQRIAEKYRARLEREVRLNPDQYLWTHRLWKRQPAPAAAALGRR